MKDFDDFLAPITREAFQKEFWDRKPLHIPASDRRGGSKILSWATFNRLLEQSSIWTPSSLKMVFNNEPIDADAYCSPVHIHGGLRSQPQPAKMAGMLAMGASLIAEDAQYLTPEISSAARILGDQYGALVAANIYCSFKGVQAFGPHYDAHDVFAVQTEGEKVWRLYANRAEVPIGYPELGGDRQIRSWLNQSKGALVGEVRMRPGDVLYVPRGWYHDALAIDGPSLHVTFSVTPLYGRILFRVLEEAALKDPAFRVWLPPAAADGGAALSSMLADLGQRLARMAASPAIRDEVIMAQERLRPRDAAFDLPQRAALTRLRRVQGTPPRLDGLSAQIVEWILQQDTVALEDMVAQFDFVPETIVRDAVAACERTGLLVRI